MATPRQTIGDKLGQAIRAIKGRAVTTFLSARPDPNAELTEAERSELFDKVWKAVGAALTPTSPNGSVTIGTQNDSDGIPQLTLLAAGGDGAAWYVSDGTPSGDLGTDGDMCLDLGEDDAEHPRPTRWYVRDSAPPDTLGYENDLCLVTTTGNVYERGVDSWGDPKMRLEGSGGDEAYTAVTIADGVISGFGDARNLLVSGTGPLVGIETTTLPATLRLTFVVDMVITAMGSPSSGAPIKTPRMGDTNPQDIHALADDVVTVLLRTGVGTPFWKVIGGGYT